MSALAQCDAFAFIYDQAGDPAPDVLVVLKRVLDAGGNPILLGPKTTTTDSAGSFHFTLPEAATAFISARASALWNCPEGRAFTVPPGPSGELVPDFSLPASTLVEPPLVYVGDVLSIPKASETQDGYLSAADYVAFLAGGAEVGITQINTGTGLTGGPITDTGTISLAPVSGVAGSWSNPTSITINAYGQVIAITATADTTAPVISAISATSITGSGATIIWTTDDPSDSQVEYGTTTSYGSTTTLDTTPVTSHSVPITGTAASTPYHYRVKSRNTAGLLTTSGDNTFTTTAVVDTTPPAISAITATSITDTGATITWTTDDLSDSQVEYGLTTSYGSTTSIDATMVTSHSVPITGTTATTLYHYRVKSRNAASLLATSPDHTFTTTAVVDTTPPVISAITSSGLTDTGATISWTTDDLSDSQVEYGPTTSYGSSTVIDASMVTSHSVPLTGLTASTLYHYRVKSKNAVPLSTTSSDSTLTTLAPMPDVLTGLVSYWKFEESSGPRADTVGPNHLTVGGTVGTVPGIAGLPGTLAATSGPSANGFLYTTDHPSQSFAGSMSIAGWMAVHTTVSPPTEHHMLSKYYTGQHSYDVSWYEGFNVYQFAVTADDVSYAYAQIPNIPTVDVFVFIAAVFDFSASEIRLSINDGTPVTTPFVGPLFTSTTALGILTGSGVLSDAFVDEVGLWGKALSAAEITYLYNGGNGRTHPFT